MLFTVWVVFHLLVCIALVLVVLMQSSKGEGLAGSAFGGGLSGAVFGGRGAATFLQNATTVLAVVFMINCGALALQSASSRQVATAGGEVESAVTRQAQQEMQRAMQQQQAQQQAAQSDTAATNLIDVMTSEGEAQPATQDSAGQ